MALAGRPGRALPAALRRSLEADRAASVAYASPSDRLAADQARKKPLFDAAVARRLAAGFSETQARAYAKREVPGYLG
jgi:hypothetical protein